MSKRASYLPYLVKINKQETEQEPVEEFRVPVKTPDTREKQNHVSCGKLLDRVLNGSKVHYKHPKKPLRTLCGLNHSPSDPNTRYTPPGADYSDLDLDYVTCKKCLQVVGMRANAQRYAIQRWKNR